MDKQKSKLLDPDVYCRLGSYLDLGLTQGTFPIIINKQLIAILSAYGEFILLLFRFRFDEKHIRNTIGFVEKCRDKSSQ